MGYDCQVDTNPKARKDHWCHECGKVIPKGEVYHKQTGIGDSTPYTWKVHKQCAGLYWALNKINFAYGDPIPTSDFCLEEMEHLRGRFPHAVNRWDLMNQKAHI